MISSREDIGYIDFTIKISKLLNSNSKKLILKIFCWSLHLIVWETLLRGAILVNKTASNLLELDEILEKLETQRPRHKPVKSL